MNRQAHCLLLTFGHGLPRRLVCTNRHQGNFSRWSFDTVLIYEREIDFLDDLQNRFSLKRRAIQSMLNLGEKLRIQSL